MSRSRQKSTIQSHSSILSPPRNPRKTLLIGYLGLGLNVEPPIMDDACRDFIVAFFKYGMMLAATSPFAIVDIENHFYCFSAMDPPHFPRRQALELRGSKDILILLVNGSMGPGYFMVMNFCHTATQPTTGMKTNGRFPNVDKAMMVAEELRENRDSSSSSVSTRHVLFPSRSPPPMTKKRSSTKEKVKTPSLAHVIDGFAAAKITPTNSTTTAGAASSPPKRFFRQTLHRRNKHLFVSSHSPTKSKSSSPSKTKSFRKHHRRHNLALNATDFEILFKK